MKVTTVKKVLYDPSRFNDVETVEEAVNIILTPEEGMTSKGRWNNEAPVIMKLIEKHIAKGSRVLDYGCGVGRMAMPLIRALGCSVVGVDISPNMRALANSMVDSPLFLPVDPLMFDVIKPGIFDAAISIWALQHCIDLKAACERIATGVKVGGKLVLFNQRQRLIPVDATAWADDGLKVNVELGDVGFDLLEEGIPDISIAPGQMQKTAFWAVFERK